MVPEHFWHVCRHFEVVWSIWPWDDLQGQGANTPNCFNDYPRPVAYCYRVVGLMWYSWQWIWHVVGTWLGIWDLDMTLTSNANVEAVRPTLGLPNKKRSWAYHSPLSRYGPWKFCQPLAYKTAFAYRILEPWLVDYDLTKDIVSRKPDYYI